MQFGRTNPHFVHKLDNEAIQQTNKKENDNQLKFHVHIVLVARKPIYRIIFFH